MRVRWNTTLLLIAFCFIVAPMRSFADSISFTIIDPSQAVTAGQTVQFAGTITNGTSIDLTASDFFLNFSDYDPAALSFAQLLGLDNFPIPSGTTTSLALLFSATLAPGTPRGSYSAIVTLQDVNDHLSVPVTINLRVAAVPEPETVTYMILGLISIFAVVAQRSMNIA